MQPIHHLDALPATIASRQQERGVPLAPCHVELAHFGQRSEPEPRHRAHWRQDNLSWQRRCAYPCGIRELEKQPHKLHSPTLRAPKRLSTVCASACI